VTRDDGDRSCDSTTDAGRSVATGNRLVLGIGCLTLLSFVIGYAWAAGWVDETWAVEASVTHCLLGGGILGISAALGVWIVS